MTIIAAVGLSLPFLAYLLLQGALASKAVLLFLVFMVLAYSLPVLRFKERPFLDSITSSTHFAGPLVYALVLTGWQPYYWPYVMAFSLWGIASHAFGAVQDIQADRGAGISSIGTVLGAKPTVWFAFALYIASGLRLVSLGLAGPILAGLAGVYALNVAQFLRISDRSNETAHHGWRRFIWLNWLGGFVITLLLIGYFRNY